MTIDSTGYRLVLSTCPSVEVAEELASTLVEARLVACVNIIPGIRSIYRWQDQIEKDEEVLLIAKTTKECYSAVEQHIRTRHPYELPEIVSVGIATGLADYLAWISSCVDS